MSKKKPAARPVPACRRIAVVTSEFHMPRTRATFDFVYNLAGSQLYGDAAWFHLDYRPGGWVIIGAQRWICRAGHQGGALPLLLPAAAETAAHSRSPHLLASLSLPPACSERRGHFRCRRAGRSRREGGGRGGGLAAQHRRRACGLAGCLCGDVRARLPRACDATSREPALASAAATPFPSLPAWPAWRTCTPGCTPRISATASPGSTSLGGSETWTPGWRPRTSEGQLQQHSRWPACARCPACLL